MWLDTAANDHFMWDRSVFKSYKRTANLNADLCEGTSPIAGEGTIIIPLGNMAVEVTAKHAPRFTDNLIAISKLVKKGFRVEIDSSEGFDGLTITHRYTGKTVLRSPVQNGLYPILGPQGLLNPSAKKTDISLQRQATHWHEVVGHIGSTRLYRASNGNIGIPPLPLEVIKETQCVACLEGSTRRSPVRPLEEKTDFDLDLTHTDIAGPIHPTTQADNKYVAVFLDDATKMSAVYLLKTRSLFADALQAYRALVENEQNRRMYRTRLDRAGEITSTAVFEMSLQHGIKLEYSPPYASQSNGAAERLIQELWKMERTMLLASKLPLSFWGEAISYANWLRNRLPSHSIGLEIPFEVWYGHKPNLSTVLRFGQPGYSFQYKPEMQRQKKLLPRSLFSHFVGMEGNQRLYRVFIPSKNGISFCRAADFTPLKDQSQFPTVTELLDGIARQREFEEQNDNPVAADEAEESLVRAMFTLSSQTPFAGKAKGRSRDSRLPRNFEHARQNPRWAEAIDREYKALVERGTWRLIPFRSGMKPLPFTWQFKVKETPGAEIESLYKARCCLRGDKEMPFRDFDPDALYAPVA